jgi:sugar phosphate isomerase/epimerase
MKPRVSPRIGFSTNVFDNPADIVATTQAILQDFPDVEIEIEDEAKDFVRGATPQEYEQTTARLRELLQGAERQISVHAPYLSQSTNLASADALVRADAVAQIRQAIVFCADIGGDRVTYHPGFNDAAFTKAALTDNLKRSIEELQKDATKRGVMLCLENMGQGRPKYLVYSGEEHLELHRQTGTWVTLDLVHLASWGHGPDDLAREMATYAPISRNIHFNDMPQQQHRHVPPGDGVLPLSDMLKAMWSYGYRDAAIIDEFARPIPAARYVARGRELVAQIEDAVAA